MNNKNYYNINFATTGIMLLPTFLRKPMLIAVTTAIMKVLDEQQREMHRFLESLEMETLSQTCFLEGLINDNFDFFERRIKVRNAPIDKDYYLFWEEAQNKPVKLMEETAPDFEPYMLSTDGQTGCFNYDFEIVLPVGFTLSPEETNRLMALIDSHKLSSKRYRIING